MKTVIFKDKDGHIMLADGVSPCSSCGKPSAGSIIRVTKGVNTAPRMDIAQSYYNEETGEDECDNCPK